MQHQQLTPEQKARSKKREERRRRERERRVEEYRRYIERLRRQIAEARKRRQRMLLLFLLAVLAMQEKLSVALKSSFSPRPVRPTSSGKWTPSPENDFAAQADHDDHCDGYSRKEWTLMLDERGIKLSRKAEMKSAWEADPDHELFPPRYRNWGYRPFLGEVMNDLSEPRYQPDALKGLKLLSPPETHQYLDEVYAVNPLDLLHCRAALSADIVRNFQRRAVVWEEHKKQAAEEARKAKNDKKPDGDEKSFDP